MKTTTVRNIPAELAEALGISTDRRRSNGLRDLSGHWTEEEFRQFENAVAPFGEIDGELWK